MATGLLVPIERVSTEAGATFFAVVFFAVTFFAACFAGVAAFFGTDLLLTAFLAIPTSHSLVKGHHIGSAWLHNRLFVGRATLPERARRQFAFLHLQHSLTACWKRSKASAPSCIGACGFSVFMDMILRRSVQWLRERIDEQRAHSGCVSNRDRPGRGVLEFF